MFQYLHRIRAERPNSPSTIKLERNVEFSLKEAQLASPMILASLKRTAIYYWSESVVALLQRKVIYSKARNLGSSEKIGALLLYKVSLISFPDIHLTCTSTDIMAFVVHILLIATFVAIFTFPFSASADASKSN